jgi:DNA-binding CsgD family transcriptional regulator
MLSPILVGRDGHLDVADARLADAAAGHGRTLLIAGEAGIGKTRFLRAVIRRAKTLGFDYIKGDLAPQDHDVPGAVLLDFARMMQESPATADAGSRILERWTTATAEGGIYSRPLVLETVEHIRASLDGPMVLAFEDLQWADDLSLEAIGELARTIESRRVLILATHRRDETPADAPLRSWRSRLLTQRQAEEIRLDRLTPAQTATMVSLLLESGLPAPSEVTSAIHERSDGVPLHIEELFAAVRAQGPVDVGAIREVGVPDTIEDAVLARTARLSPEAQAVARAGAVLGRCFVPDVLAGVMDVPVAELEEPLEELVDHSILYPFGEKDVGYHDFRHQLLRDALYRHTPARERRRYHARAAEFGAGLVGQTEVHASLHYARAGLRDEAFRTALAGAEAATRVSAHREAFELYRRAVEFIPADMPALERGQLLERYGDEAGAIEQNDIALQVAWDARAAYQAAGHPDAAAMILGLVLTIWRRTGQPLSERRALYEQIIAEIAALPPGPDRDRAMLWATYDRVVIEADENAFDAVDATLAELESLATALGEADIMLAANTRGAMMQIARGDVGPGLRRMTEIAATARDAGYEEVGVTAFRDTAVLALRAMEYDIARTSMVEGRVYADSIQQSHCAHVMASLDASLDWAAGRWDEAIASGEQAIVDRGCSRAPAMARHGLGYVAMGRGESEAARTALEASRAWGDTSEMVEYRLPPRWGLAELALLDGDPSGAVAWCEDALAIARAANERALLAPFVVTGVRAYQAAGRPAEAERWLAACRDHLASTPAFAYPALTHGEGLVALAAGATGVARRSLEDAVAGWEARGRIWETNWARLDLASALARTNRYAAAVAVAGQVQAAAESLKSEALRSRAEAIVRQGRGHVAEVEPWHPLTAREFEVARLIAEGCTNAEVAEALGIAPKTASAHVEHILAKLGASRRAEIASWASQVVGGGSAPSSGGTRIAAAS